jgi:hypothetical protein
MRTAYILIASTAAAWASMLACSSSPDIGSTSANSTQSNLEQQLAAAWTDPTYTTDGAPFQTITLSQNGSFQWSAPCVSQGVATCQSIRTDSGNWSVGTSGPQLGAPQGATQLKLVDQFNQETDYFVQLSSGNMVLSTAITLGSTYTFTVGSNIQPAPSGDGDGGTPDGGSVGEGGSGSDDGGSGDDGGWADSSSGDDGGTG